VVAVMINIKAETIKNPELIKDNIKEFLQATTDKTKCQFKTRWTNEETNISVSDIIVQLKNGMEILASIHEINGWSISVLIIDVAESGTFEL